ncbi:bifunctional glutamate N-acetyltransferase/amino-acid acetyltransferase ArgJ [Stomatohabitans albus]|uniref:bifunctional glutamate N-acetyltransferase/amino-acid acetyltransferase ArgJ n=1 Tax=Stomatohabitans albus TaxID=3110766 RepID=UPI00300D5085
MFITSPLDRAHGITRAQGFQAASTYAGLRASQRDDLTVIVAQSAVQCAVVSTSNKVKAAPIRLNLEHLAQSNHQARAVVINTANANACTGAPGMDTARQTATALADLLDEPTYHVLVASTGIIGEPLEAAPIVRALPALVHQLGRGEPVDHRVAKAIMTTDTVPKLASVTLQEHGADPVVIGGMAKGSGMISPGMATTITVITTDANLSHDDLSNALTQATQASFNRINVDGAMSTNDTIILLASGLAGPVDPIPFTQALTDVCADLAYQVIADGEGATQVVKVMVTGAAADAQADQAARHIGADLLVRTAFAGRDPNWGRLVAAAGASGVDLDPNELRVMIAGTTLCEHSLPLPIDRDLVSAQMDQPYVELSVDLGVGQGSGWVLVNDLTKAYITINAEYTT